MRDRDSNQGEDQSGESEGGAEKPRRDLSNSDAVITDEHGNQRVEMDILQKGGYENVRDVELDDEE